MKEKMLRKLVIKKSLLFLLFLLSFSLLKAQKTYQINYRDDGSLASHGWINNGIKEDYWKFYYENGKLEREGHFLNDKEHNYWFYYNENGHKIREGHYSLGKMTNWWNFYKDQKIYIKCEYANDKKNGYCIMFSNEKPIKAMHYVDDLKINEWDSYFSFIKDNPSINPL